MNIETTNVNHSETKQKTNLQNNKNSSVKFVDELQKVAESEEVGNDTTEKVGIDVSEEVGFDTTEEVSELNEPVNEFKQNIEADESQEVVKSDKEQVQISISIQKNVVSDVKPEDRLNVDNALNDLKSVVKKLTQSDEKMPELLKPEIDKVDTKEKGENLINNDLNITENKEILPQMTPNMNFSGDKQPFSDFVDNKANKSELNKLNSSAEDLAEEAAILSTMAENIAIANKNNIVKTENKPEREVKKSAQVKRNIFDQTSQLPQDLGQEQVKTVTRNNVVKKVDTKTNITVENVVKLDSVVMNEADVEFFAELVQKGEVNLKNIASEAAKRAVQISKTLADMLAKSMENNQPLRIDFDNNISVIIRISRDGKISADFLPSSQVAEAYLKENLPLLRQKFDDSNIKYDELNQRERREQREHSRKKGRDNE